MKFSVIVPIYNVEKYLEQCVNSILSQTFADFELILVDDGSPDRSPAMCDEFARQDSRIKVIHKKNGGLSDARNAGIRAATGEYLIFIDSDDFYAHDRVFQTVAEEINRKNPDIVRFQCKIFLEESGSYNERISVDISVCNTLDNAAMLELLAQNNMFEISAYLHVVRRRFLLEHDLYFPAGKKSEDIKWGIFLYSYLPSISVLPDVCYVYRVGRNDSITASMDYKHLLDYCDIIEESVAHVEKMDSAGKVPLLSYCMYHTLICIAHTMRLKLSRQERKTALAKLKKVCRNRITVYTLDSRVRLAGKIYRFAGFYLMAWILGFYLSHRGESSHSYATKVTPAN